MRRLLTKGMAASMAALLALGTISLPTFAGEEENTLTVWGEASVWLPTNETDISKSPFLDALQEATGVKLDLTAASGDVGQQFNLMIAGGKENLPDIIDSANRFEGGAAAAYEKGYIIALNDYIDEYAPNYKKFLEEHPEIDKLVKTDDGLYLTFPMIRGTDELCCFNGLIIRKDWLDQAGLDVPVTIEDWYHALTVFRDDFGATAPIVLDGTNYWNYQNFASAYGTYYGYYQRDGQVVFGPVEDSFKDFLTEMNKWYEEGLIDPNFLTTDSKAIDAAMTTGQAGARWGAVGGGLGKYMEAMEPTDPEYELVGAPTPVLNEGDTPMIGFKNDYAAITGMAITTNCENIELAMKFLDYGYSEEGNTLYNFGIEGVSYELVDGEPVYTELITKNPDGLTMSQAMSYYIGASHMGGGFVQDLRYYNQYLARPQQREAVATWAQTEASDYLLPPLTYTAEENSELGSLNTDINTLVDESVAGFITGTRSLDEFEDFVEEVKDMDLERAIEIEQAALERFNDK